jgi:FAD/FMN-containing dehydrogenase
VGPGDLPYEHARRVWNAAIDRRPAAVVRCGTAEEVRDAIGTLRRLELPFTLRGGGHNVAGNAVRDDTVLVDLSGLRTITFDAERGTVSVGAGCVWGEVDRAAADRRCVVPTGMISHTGVAGLTLGGGTGYLTRQLGTTSDSLVEADVILADGSSVRVSSAARPDLLWALRGAGHNFAAVTRFEFRVHELSSPVYVRQSIFDASARAAVLALYREWAPLQPRTLTSYVNLLRIPPHWPWLPSEHRGQPAVNVTSVFYGTEEDGLRATEALHGIAPALWNKACSMRHVELQHACDDDWRWGVHHYWKPAFLSGIPDEAIETIIHWCDAAPAVYEQARSKISPQPINLFEVNYRGGALCDADPSQSAYSDRVSPYNSNIQAVWTRSEDEQRLLAWAAAFSNAMAPHWSGAYINFMSDGGDAPEAARIFGEEKYEQLITTKQTYDPDDVFSSGGLDLRRLAALGRSAG